MNHRIAFAAASCFLLTVAALPLGVPAADEPPRIAKEQVKTWLGDPAVSIIDARRDSDWDRDDRKIPGAVRRDPNDVGSWASDYPKERTLVVYCA